MKRLLMPLALAVTSLAAEPKVLVPANGAPPVGPYVPGLVVGDYVYVSGQGVRDSQSKIAEGIEAQTRQCIANVKAVLDAAGVSLDDVVSVQLYLADLKNLPVVEKLYLAAFTKDPARVTLGVARMPTDTTVEITVVAKKAGSAADKVYLPAVYGTSAADVEKRLVASLKKAGLSGKSVVYANRYVVGAGGAGVVPVNALPGGASHAIFAVVAKTAPVGHAFCEAIAGEPGGSLEEQTSGVFAKLKGCLTKSGMTLENVVATNVYVDDLNEFAKINAVYATYFPVARPTRTTVQPVGAGVMKGSLVRISAFAVK